WEGLFAMGCFCQLTPMVAHRNQHKARPHDRALVFFSLLNRQWLAFTCRKDGQIAGYFHHFLAISGLISHLSEFTGGQISLLPPAGCREVPY
ncbi:hypothetical protein, partial [Aeromonas sp. 602658]|uniref:hypothetical protein n=1 Tax=Aeromonas sp. 602658 TaxID=2712043 RepID=UPI003BA0323D